MKCFYLWSLLSLSLLSGTIYGQVNANDDSAGPIPEEGQITFNVTDNDVSLTGINEATVDLNPGAIGRQTSFSDDAGQWTVDDEGNVTYTAATNFYGTASASYRVADNLLPLPLLSNTADITVEVVNENDPPEIAPIGDLSTNEDTPTGPISLSLNDVDNDPGDLAVTATSGNPTVVPDDNIEITGGGFNKNITITPAPGQTGVAEIEITVSDGDDQTTETFQLEVRADNEAPTISSIDDQEISANTSTGAIAITVGDPDGGIGSLTLNGASSNTTLVPDANITFGGGGANRTVTITPANNQTGTTTIEITVSDGDLTATTNFTLTVNANQPPTISNIADQTLTMNNPSGALAFTVGDPDGGVGSLTVTGTSSNTTLVPNANITLGGSGANRTVTITPANNQTGTTTIGLTVSDGTATASTSFTVTVNAPNQAPTISSIANQSLTMNTPSSALAFTVGDPDGGVGSLTVTGTSSNTTVVPNANITIGGGGANRTVTITPANNQTGTTTIELTVSDGSETSSTSFTVTVNAPNQAPTISDIANQTITVNNATGALAFTVGDPNGGVGSLTVTGTSSNTTLVPNANIVFGGSGANRTVTITPAANQTGITTIELTVSDGDLSATTDFTVTVNPPANQPPTISDIPNQNLVENTSSGAISFTVGDPNGGVGSLTVSGTSSNTTLVPNANIIFGGSGANRNVTITPANNQTGTATIEVTVSDGALAASTSFTVTVNAPPNQPPTISAIADQTTSENTATGAIPFTIGDDQTAPGALTLTASSSNPTIVPVANITFGGSGTNRNVTINPGASQSGTVTITITVSDGTLTASENFALTIEAINDSPTITPIDDQTIAENSTTGPLPFSIGDAETPAANLLVNATSSVTTLVPNGNINIEGNGSDRVITIVPAAGQSGTTVITISVSDGTATTTTSFTVTVDSVNDPPTITAIGNQTIQEDTPTAALPFTLSDPDTPAGSLTVTATSSNTTLVPNANIALFGDGVSRTVTVTPATNQTGTTTITLTVSDGTATATTSFQVTVTPVNDEPAISAISNQSTTEGKATAAIPFTVQDAETDAGSLTVTASSSNTALVTGANIVIEGSGGSRTVTITPTAGANGVTTITLTVSDGTATASTSFQLTVIDVNDPPTITAIPAQTTNEDIPTNAIPFTIGDPDTPIGSLAVTASSSNKTLVPDANISISNSGATRNAIITPATNQFGTTTITITVSDGGSTAESQFTLTVNPVNDAPTITGQVALTTPENTPITLLPEHFTISDPDGSEDGYSIIIIQSPNYQVNENTVTPPKDFDGELEVTIRIVDGKLQSPEYVATIVVTDVNVAPVIVGQNEIRIPKNQSYTLLTSALNIQDPDSPIEGMTLTVSPGEHYLLSGTSLTTITPTLDYVGPLEVVVTVNDGKVESEPFTVEIEVFEPGSDPVIAGQESLIINEDETLELEFTHLIVTDTDNEYPRGFTINVLPAANNEYTATGNAITPALNFNGILDVLVTVNDGKVSSAPFTLRIYVLPVNDAPEITMFETSEIFYEPGSGPVPITEAFECADVDNEFLTYAEIAIIDENYSERNDELIYETADNSPVRGIYDAARGVLSLVGVATPEQYIEAIRSVHYNYRLTQEANGEPSLISTTPKQLAITLSDGQLISESKSRTINLETSVELNIPNAFTPNGDPSNNTWAIQAVTPSDQFKETIIRVYNKRGMLVYESTGLENEWDGTYKGELLPVDTYYYTIDLRLSFIKKTYKGYVTILR